MSNFQLDILEVQKLHLIEKIETYFQSIEELKIIHFQIVNTLKDNFEKKEILLSAHIHCDDSRFIWTKNGVANFSEDTEEQDILIKQLSKFNFNINYYLQKGNEHIYFEDIYKDLVESYHIGIFDQVNIKFTKENFNTDTDLFLGSKTLRKLDSIELNSLLKVNPNKSVFLKI